MEYEFHDVANLFPMMTEEESRALKEDMVKYGLREPIVLFEGKILDGRNRYVACKEASILPRFIDIQTDDPVAYVRSHNLHRRQLTLSQTAMIAAKCLDYYKAKAKERQREHGGTAPGRSKNTCVQPTTSVPAPKSRDEVGKAFGVGGATVGRAARVLRDGSPELVKDVEEGRTTVNAAVATLQESEPAEVESAPGRAAAITPRLGRQYANIAIMQLSKIAANDAERKEAFDMVTEWIGANK